MSTRSRKRVVILCAVFGVLILLGPYGDSRVSAIDRNTYKSLKTFSEVLDMVEKNYVEPVDAEKLMQGAINGMIKSLDPHSVFMTAEMHKELEVETRGTFGGLGIEITILKDVLTVVSPIEDTPAYNAGIKAGDQIIKIDDVTTKDITITVKGDYNNDLNDKKGIKVYLFTPSGSYTGRNATTDDQGRAIFSLPAKDYKVRADFLSKQYWSDTFSGINQTVTIKEGMADITVTGQGVGLNGIKVYAFNDTGTYLGISGVSDEDGQMSFRLPEGIYTFRADYLGNQYWSGNSTLISHVQNPVPISTGGGSFTLTLEKTGAIPMSNINCYLFSENGSYLNAYKTTGGNGTADFTAQHSRNQKEKH